MRRTTPVAVRFWAKVDKTPTCWLWTGAKTGSGGYGVIRLGDTLVRAHRFAYEAMVGPIPDGLVLDHLCRVRACVNPGHLEPVTTQENVLRGEGPAASRAKQTACKYGHPFDEANTRITKLGQRRCRVCHQDHKRASRRRVA